MIRYFTDVGHITEDNYEEHLANEIDIWENEEHWFEEDTEALFKIIAILKDKLNVK